MLFYSKLSTIYSVIIVVYGLYRIFTKKNADGAAHMVAAYVVGIEVLFRMNSGGFGYEFGKYAVIILLMMGLIVEKRKKIIPFAYIGFIVLLLPSILFVNYPTFEFTRQMVAFNLSGPICLGISAIYFYRRKLNRVQLRKLLLSLLYPISAMAVFLYFKTGSLDELQFTTDSNFMASGGFGPNQVSTILGLGILIIAASYFLNIRLFRFKYMNMILLATFVVRGLATFSRGGMLAPLIAVVLCIIIMTLSDAQFQSKVNTIVYAVLATFTIGFVGFNYVNDVSGGLLEKRFKGESMYNAEKKDLLSGRDEIFKEDLEVFEENIFTGVGPGMARSARAEMGGVESAAHIEYSRMLAEHGIFGLIAILVMLIFPVKTFFKMNSTDDKILLILCIAFVFVTLGHAAMRTAAPAFIYGLAFINIVKVRP